VGTRRNLLGPLHHGEKYPNWTGPGEFKREVKWIGEYVSFPYGLMGGVSLSIRA
jgi:hypothetical protein